MADFPAGMKLTLVQVAMIDFSAGHDEVEWTIQPETPAMWVATGEIFNGAKIRKYLINGHSQMLLPQTDQVGFINPDDGSPVINFGYKSVLKPTRSPAAETTWFYLTATDGVEGSDGNRVEQLGRLHDIGAWPNQSIIINPPAGGGGGFEEVTVPGNTGPLGYWSPVL